jgi:hypothetical protein
MQANAKDVRYKWVNMIEDSASLSSFIHMLFAMCYRDSQSRVPINDYYYRFKYLALLPE